MIRAFFLVSLAALTAASLAWLTAPVYRLTAIIAIDADADERAVVVEQLKARIADRDFVTAVSADEALGIVTTPLYRPVVGAALARGHASDAVEPTPAAVGRDAVGGERLFVDLFEPPAQAPARQYTLTARGNDTYTLSVDGDVVLEGRAGDIVRATDSSLALRVRLIAAASGSRFSVQRIADDSVADRLLGRVRMTERGATQALLQLTVDGDAPGWLTHALDALTAALVAHGNDTVYARAVAAATQAAQAARAAGDDATVAGARLDDFVRQHADVRLDAATRVDVFAYAARPGGDDSALVRLNAKIASLDEPQRTRAELELDAAVSAARHLRALSATQDLQDAAEAKRNLVRVLKNATADPFVLGAEQYLRYALPGAVVGLLVAVSLGALSSRRRRLARTALAEILEATLGLRILAVLPAETPRGRTQDAEAGREAGKSLAVALGIAQLGAPACRGVVFMPAAAEPSAQDAVTQCAAAFVTTGAVAGPADALTAAHGDFDADRLLVVVARDPGDSVARVRQLLRRAAEAGVTVAGAVVVAVLAA